MPEEVPKLRTRLQGRTDKGGRFFPSLGRAIGAGVKGEASTKRAQVMMGERLELESRTFSRQ